MFGLITGGESGRTTKRRFAAEQRETVRHKFVTMFSINLKASGSLFVKIRNLNPGAQFIFCGDAQAGLSALSSTSSTAPGQIEISIFEIRKLRFVN